MKRLLPLPLILIFALTACTRQQQINAEIYLASLGDALHIAVNTKEILYENQTATIYLTEGETELLIRAVAADENLQELCRIGLTTPCTAESYALLRRAFAATVPLLTADNTEAVTKELELPDNLPSTLLVTHCETQFYRYAFYATEAGITLTAESKAHFPEGEKITLTRRQG